jgi:uncharacterized protein YgiM (DUF1202 family)
LDYDSNTRKVILRNTLFISSLACNFSNPQAPEEPHPEVVTIVVTAAPLPPSETPDEDEQGAYAIFKQDLNVRSGPGTTCPIQDQLQGGKQVDNL